MDPSRYAGTCYRASNWVWLGLTRGFAREPGGSARWREHGQPKEVYVYELGTGARRRCAPTSFRGTAAPKGGSPPLASELRSLHAFLEGIPDFRKARGVRYGLTCHATIMIAARLAGYRGVAAFGEFAARLDQEQLRAAGAFFRPSRRCWTVPGASTFHYILSSLPPDALDRALGAWARHCSAGAPVAPDGKDVRGASRRAGDGRVMLVAAVEHGNGLVLGQMRVGEKTNEMPAARELTRALDLGGRTVTLDAQRETARPPWSRTAAPTTW